MMTSKLMMAPKHVQFRLRLSSVRKLMQHMTPNRARLTEILHYGFLLQSGGKSLHIPFDNDTLEVASQRRAAFGEHGPAHFREGLQIWHDACRRIAQRADKPLLLPLSSGLDSRAVLAGLLDCGAEVTTFTYGIPGSFDYDLAPHIAQQAGVTHERIDLRTIRITREALLELAREPGRISSVLDMFFNRAAYARIGSNYQYVTGYMGDELGGKNMPSVASATWQQACRAFAKSHQSGRDDSLLGSGMNPVSVLPEQPLVDTQLLAPDHQLYLAIRQECNDRPISSPTTLNVVSPFTDSEAAAFMLGVPDDIRRHREFLIPMFQHGYPELFALPGTASGGLPLGASADEIRRYKRKLRRKMRTRRKMNRIFSAIGVPPSDRNWQYLDFPSLLRGDHDLSALFADAMKRLDDSGIVPWIDASGLLKAHREHKGNHFKALNVLLNLDITREARPELLFSPN